MDRGSKFLSDLVLNRTYAAVKEDGRKESRDEVIERVLDHHSFKFPQFSDEIKRRVEGPLKKGQVVPAMRWMQFAGEGIRRNEVRGYNCSATSVESFQDFAEIFYVLMCGAGMGYSVQRHHVNKLPDIPEGKAERFKIPDNKEGWADSVRVLLENPKVEFDYSDIRPKGAKLSTGGTASGPSALQLLHDRMRTILKDKKQLTPLMVHDIICCIADGVVVGGARRSALISLFDPDDDEMLSCKHGAWWESAPWRGRANNSAVINRNSINAGHLFDGVMTACFNSNSGEPGIYWTNHEDWLTNPCCLSLDTTLLTPQGIKKLKDVDEGQEIWSGECWTRILRKWKTGTKPVYRYRTNAGYFLGTEDHQIYCDDKKSKVDEVEGIDRCLGPCIAPTELSPADILNGLLVGDGSIHKASGNLIGLYIGDEDGDYHTSEIAPLLKQHRPGVNPKFWEVETDLEPADFPRVELRGIPDKYLYGTINQKSAFLRGIFSANGTVTANRVQYKTACKRQALQLQEMLSSLGYKTSMVTNKPTTAQHHNGKYTSKESYNLIMYNHAEEFVRNIGFLQKYKMRKSVKNAKERTSRSNIVEKEFVGVEEVYDIMVENDKHRFWSGGCLVSNCEIALRSKQFCNLTEVNVAACKTQQELAEAVQAAAILGTLQASYTNFTYLDPRWQKNCEDEALLGVSLTGLGEKWELVEHGPSLQFLSHLVGATNKLWADKIGIKPAARQTCVKPSGTASAYFGTTSGIHAAHAEYYIRRVRIDTDHPLATYLVQELPEEYIEKDQFNPDNWVVSIPVKMKDAILRDEESPIALMERAKHIAEQWVSTGHVAGKNTHNVSMTVSYKDEEKEQVMRWMWDNREFYNGISLLPHSGSSYVQMPFEAITEAEYKKLLKGFPTLDLSQVSYKEIEDDRQGEAACAAGGSCEWGV